MPTKNSQKQYVCSAYFHVYNRGVNKRAIFIDDQDYLVFTSLLKRYLGDKTKNGKYRVYDNYNGRVELLAYCLMPNHFHLMFYLVKSKKSISALMRQVSSSYTNYFNTKYERVGHLFQGVYKAKHIDDDAYLQHISRYIHLNPKKYIEWKYSSFSYFVTDTCPVWVKPGRVMEVFDNDRNAYASFVSDYTNQKDCMDIIKHQLADW